MKLPPSRVDAFLRRPDPAVFAVLVYGPDQGLVRERAQSLVRAAAKDPDDPFTVLSFTSEGLKSDPPALADQARSLSLLGDRQVLRVRAASELAVPACKLLLDLDRADALVVLEAGDLNPRSALRRLFEDGRNAAAIACYRESGNELAASLRSLLSERNLRPEEGVIDLLGRHLGADRGLTRQEVDKLALYAGATEDGPPVPVTLEDAATAIGDSAVLGLDDLAEAVGLGETGRIDRVLERLFGEGVHPVAAVRALQNHVGRLARLRSARDKGDPVDRAIDGLRPPVHFRLKPGLRRQVELWPAPALARALADLLEAEIGCKTTGLPAEALASRVVWQLALRARPRP
ncbi:DNA polymerase III subunit delta [Marinivivus vitaminiproducens]|uniref:DNA polymerase III subunit delta n=1 Tax=Marinivivus vitaminiproducens TaxID=3035935 RepID=UPI002799C12B|nr:DNA polymerase III subunit delta [Geminicoccaceae bacterium SCSIO 64248]